MHKHDLDLIASLADGSVDDETEARALVESCVECRAEYQSQLTVLEILTSTPSVMMSDLEKAALHRDLWTELRSEPATRASGASWYRWAYVAAGLLVTVGLAGVLNGQIGFGGADDSDTFAEISSGLGQFSADGLEDAPASDTDAASGGGDETVVPTTAAAESLLLPFPELADQARALREDPKATTQEESEKDDIDRCLERLDLADHVVVDELELDRRYLVVMAGDDVPDQSVTFVALDECEIVYTDG
jgi:hypothetical protein